MGLNIPVVAKMLCTSVSESTNGNTSNPEKYGESVAFNAQYSDNPEDNSFAKATPSASASLFISNPDLYGKFEPGKNYYFNITEAN